MKLGIMQPYFFPYLGYFDLINRTDKWVVFDVVQYQKKSWMNRNRIHHPTEGWQYICAPVSKHDRFSQIKNIRINDSIVIKDKLLSQLAHYKKRAPYYESVCEMAATAFDSMQEETLVDLNVRGLLVVCDYLGIDFDCSVFSKMDINIPAVVHPGQWALEISSALKASEYINPPNGKDIFIESEFSERDIKLTFTSLVDFEYDCHPYEEVSHLSIIDVLMFCSPVEVKQYLDQLKV